MYKSCPSIKTNIRNKTDIVTSFSSFVTITLKIRAAVINDGFVMVLKHDDEIVIAAIS